MWIQILHGYLDTHRRYHGFLTNIWKRFHTKSKFMNSLAYFRAITAGNLSPIYARHTASWILLYNLMMEMQILYLQDCFKAMVKLTL